MSVTFQLTTDPSRSRESYNIRVAILGDERQASLNSLALIALVLQNQGKYEKAEEMNQRALAGYEKVLGLDHPNTLTSVYCLANLLDNKARPTRGS
jgi:hypothetical protein